MFFLYRGSALSQSICYFCQAAFVLIYILFSKIYEHTWDGELIQFIKRIKLSRFPSSIVIPFHVFLKLGSMNNLIMRLDQMPYIMVVAVFSDLFALKACFEFPIVYISFNISR